MDKFKIGDLVEIHTNNQCGHKIGTIGKIDSKNTIYSENTWYIVANSIIYSHFEQYLKLVKEIDLINNIEIW